jgi:hypothetical protein
MLSNTEIHEIACRKKMLELEIHDLDRKQKVHELEMLKSTIQNNTPPPNLSIIEHVTPSALSIIENVNLINPLSSNTIPIHGKVYVLLDSDSEKCIRTTDSIIKSRKTIWATPSNNTSEHWKAIYKKNKLTWQNLAFDNLWLNCKSDKDEIKDIIAFSKPDKFKIVDGRLQILNKKPNGIICNDGTNIPKCANSNDKYKPVKFTFVPINLPQ